MFDYLTERILQEGEYIANSGATVRDAGKKFGVGKSTVHKDMTERLKHIDANLYKRVKSVLEPGNPLSGIDMHGGLYGAKLYDSARKKLVPVFGVPSGKSIALKKSDKTMIVAPMSLEGRKGIYAVIPNPKRLGGYIPEKSYVLADALTPAQPGDMAVAIDADFDALDNNTTVNAQIVSVRQDSKGKVYGQISSPDEKLNSKVMHKVVMIVME